jgi:hypothetical protein
MNDPRDRINMLRQYMEAAKEFGIGGQLPWTSATAHPSINSQNSANIHGARLQWAQRMMQEGDTEQRPDFFGQDMMFGPSKAPAYVRPERMGSVTPMRGQADPMRAQTMNYLAKYLGR